MEQYLIDKGYIPLDKSWIIRMGVLDLLNDRVEDSKVFLRGRLSTLGEDLGALEQALHDFAYGDFVFVGESATLYRFLKFASWKLGQDKKFVKAGTLNDRKICDNPGIVNYSLQELLKLDNGTSQWASAAVLAGSDEVVENPPFKLRLTYEAVRHWRAQRANGLMWVPRYDQTILKQAVAFLNMLHGNNSAFVPEQAEDYCFARAFGFMTKEEGEKRWPSLRGHESDRIEEMEMVLRHADEGYEIGSKDHRVVQAYTMLQKVKKKRIEIVNRGVVSKSWPQFWTFLKDSPNIPV